MANGNGSAWAAVRMIVQVVLTIICSFTLYFMKITREEMLRLSDTMDSRNERQQTAISEIRSELATARAERAAVLVRLEKIERNTR